MQAALREARMAFEKDEVPVGAVMVFNHRIIARAHNMTQQLNDATAHAEMLAITAAARYVNARYLTDCTLYVTLEPCVMCAGALFWSQIGRVVFGADDPKGGFLRIPFPILHPRTVLVKGILAEECSQLMSHYFSLKRK